MAAPEGAPINTPEQQQDVIPDSTSTGPIQAGISTSPKPSFQRLSELVNALPVEQRARWMSYYRAAIKSGEVTAYVLAEKFSYDSGNAKHKQSQVSRYEEAIVDTADFQTWLQQTRHKAAREVERSMSAGAGRIAVTMDELLSGEVDLQALAQANQKLKTPDAPKRKKTRRQSTPGGRRQKAEG